MSNFSKWVACYGNAMSISDQKEAMWAKDITLRYPVFMPFDGDKLKLQFSNLTGTEAVKLSRVMLAKALSDKEIDTNTLTKVTFNGADEGLMEPGEDLESDEIAFDVEAGGKLMVLIYLKDFTQLNTGVLITGPLSGGQYSYGDYTQAAVADINKTRKTNWYFFLETISVRTSEENNAMVCYGDSITAQSWPDCLAKLAWEEGIRNVSIIRRAVSGTRILREYDNITYAAYGIKGEKRFKREIKVPGAKWVVIQHGINDIIHPVGIEVNPFRPWSDLPTSEELIEGVKRFYLPYAKKAGLKVYSGTLLPIYGWRTYADFRDKLRNEYNDWLRTSDEFVACVDFDKAVRNPEDVKAFGPGMDSGDHLHPSEAAYQAMAKACLETILK